MKGSLCGVLGGVFFLIGACLATESYLTFSPDQWVDANGPAIEVPGYSVPSLIDWNGDGLPDLMVGQGGGGDPEGKIRIYLNTGTLSQPLYQDFFFFPHSNQDITFPAAGCLGCFPRMATFDFDDLPDLLVGLSDGSVRFFKNRGTQENPNFSGYQQLKAIIPACDCVTEFGLSARCTLDVVDYNDDGFTDLVIGGLDGLIRPYYNKRDTGNFWLEEYPQIFVDDGNDLKVPSGRSSPVLFDLDGDGIRDLVSGNTDGQMLLYKNIGTESDPVYDSNVLFLESEGAPIDLEGKARSRPSICYWPDQDIAAPADAYPDLLIGASDGYVHLFRGIRAAEDLNGDAIVNLRDYAYLAAYWGLVPEPNEVTGDFNGDAIMDYNDVSGMFSQWRKGFGAKGYIKLHPVDPNNPKTMLQ